MNYSVGEIVETRSGQRRYTGWQEHQIISIQTVNAFAPNRPLPYYWLDNGNWSHEPNMRKKPKPPSEDAAFTRFKKTLKQLETVS